MENPSMTSGRIRLAGTHCKPHEVTIYFLDSSPATQANKGTILLIHGFPETSYQFRHVIKPLNDGGYRVIAPDYRGAGHSSHPRSGYEKVNMAADLHSLLVDHLGVKQPVHVVGQDIGGMIAHAYAARFPKDTKSVSWGECPLPGTQAYKDSKHSPGTWHFTFHWQLDIPEALVQGRERIYIKHFYDRLSNKPDAIGPKDVDYYEKVFAQPGAMRSGFDVYRAFHQDAADNKEWVDRNGKCKVPCQTLNGSASFLESIAESMASEMYENWRCSTVAGSGHWCAEENPDDFVRKILSFVDEIDGYNQRVSSASRI